MNREDVEKANELLSKIKKCESILSEPRISSFGYYSTAIRETLYTAIPEECLESCMEVIRKWKEKFEKELEQL